MLSLCLINYHVLKVYGRVEVGRYILHSCLCENLKSYTDTFVISAIEGGECAASCLSHWL
jgi:hypothetical protein